MRYNTLDQLTARSIVKGSNRACNAPAVFYNVSYADDNPSASAIYAATRFALLLPVIPSPG